MKIISAFFLLIFAAVFAAAQKPSDVLATAGNHQFTAADLDSRVREALTKIPQLLASARREALAQMVSQIMFEAEAKEKNVAIEKLLETEIRSKLPTPSDEQIKAVYEANKDSFVNKSVEEARPPIIAFLQRDAEQKALENYITALQKKYNPVINGNLESLSPGFSVILATVAGQKITSKDLLEKNKVTFYETEADVYDAARANLEEVVLNALIADEAAAENVTASDIIAREVTDQQKDYTNEEIARLQTALRDRLFAKYKAKFTLKEPAPPVQNISTDDDPAQGSANAPVTIVMFSDFQCPACSATYPVLKSVIAEYKDKVRFVERDFPLINIHENAYQAAIAANAANAQGKFFEYTEILYKNQSALDVESLLKYADQLKLDRRKFAADMKNEKFAAEIQKDIADGESYGIRGTPTIFVNGVMVRNLTAQAFREAIERALKK